MDRGLDEYVESRRQDGVDLGYLVEKKVEEEQQRELDRKRQETEIQKHAKGTFKDIVEAVITQPTGTPQGGQAGDEDEPAPEIDETEWERQEKEFQEN